jgi:hypothetical protein
MIRLRCWRWGVLAALALAWSCAGQPPADTPENRAELAAKLALLAAEHGAFDRVLDNGADLATGATIPALELDRGRSLSDAEQTLLRDTLRSVIAEFVSREQWQDIVGRIYAEEFSTEELDGILEFYDTPLGHRMIQERSSLARRVEAETEKVFNARLDEFVERADEAVAAALPAENRP